MPITWPAGLSSGPPELPGLIEASVWIAPSIRNWVSESIERSVAETMPVESDCSWPNGLPIAATGVPTSTALGGADLDRVQIEALGVDLEQRDVGVGVEADDLGLDLVAVGELDEDLVGGVDVIGAAAARAAALLGVGDDVGVGDDLALVVDHEAGALAAAGAERGSGRR